MDSEEYCFRFSKDLEDWINLSEQDRTDHLCASQRFKPTVKGRQGHHAERLYARSWRWQIT